MTELSHQSNARKFSKYHNKSTQEIGIKCVAYTNENDIIVLSIVMHSSTSSVPIQRGIEN